MFRLIEPAQILFQTGYLRSELGLKFTIGCEALPIIVYLREILTQLP